MDVDATALEGYVREAMHLAREAALAGDGPFGAVLVDERGVIVERERNRVAEHANPLAHAEMNAIRALCRRLNTQTLSGYSLYTNAAPCPMCFSAMVIVGITRLGFGAPRAAGTFPDIGIAELANRSGTRRIEVHDGILRHEAVAQLSHLA